MTRVQVQDLTERDIAALRLCAESTTDPWVPPAGKGRAAFRLARRGMVMGVPGSYGYRITDTGREALKRASNADVF